MPEVSEVTLKAFIESVWFKGLARGAMILTPVLIAGFWGAWGVATSSVALDLVVTKAEIASVAKVQDGRAADSEAFQSEIRRSVAEIDAGLDDVKTELFAVKVDIGVIKRLLQDRTDVARRE